MSGDEFQNDHKKTIAMPLVSIIIRTKNEEKWINACLQSVFDQQFSDYEVLIIDDHSKDRTLEIASS